MASVRAFDVANLDLARPQSDAYATIGTITVDGEKFIQINTYGSNNRDTPGKVSQTIRLSKSAYDELADLGKKFF